MRRPKKTKKAKMIAVGVHTVKLAKWIVARLQRGGYRAGRGGKTVFVEASQAQGVRDMRRG